MRKIIFLVLILASINSINAQAQSEKVKVEQKETTQQEETTKKEKKKKKGSFWNKVKKGVESTTGLDVSKETLFYYPELALGKWKMTLKSAIANSETGELTVIFRVMPLDGQKKAFINISDIVDGNNKTFKKRATYFPDDIRTNTFESGGYDVPAVTGVYADCKLKPIYVEKGMNTLKKITFGILHWHSIEARDIPITWTK